ncbi:MAG: hypothetical protein AAF525_08455 [Pseudomonadota bacterium]
MAEVSLSLINRYQGPVWLLGGAMTLVLGLVYFCLYMISDAPRQSDFTEAQLIGTLMMLSALPAYLLAMIVYLYRETRLTLNEMQDIGPPPQDVLATLDHLKPSWSLLIVFCALFGVEQNFYFFVRVADGQSFSLVEVVPVAGNVLLWIVVGLQIAWRFPLVLALHRYARRLRVNLYQIERVRPLAHLATRDVLVIAGAMAFMPLQSLDASFRWVNYQAGLTVGIPAAILLLCLTLSGIRYAIVGAKDERIAEIQTEILKTDRHDVVRLEMLSAHRARIKAMSNWPFDSTVVRKLLFYVIIVPIAWAGAALVENLVDALSG